MTGSLMEDKQLDLNRPLLSVRRIFSKGAPQDVCRKKLDSSHPIIPYPFSYRSELKSGPVRNPGTVPFQWEKSPGRPKDERKLKNYPSERPPLVPKLPPGRTMNAEKHKSDRICIVENVLQSETDVASPSCQNMSSSGTDAGKDDRSSDGLEEKSSSDADDDEAYLDARDTLSRTESSLARCLSSLSRLDGPDMEVLTEPQTLDIMMGRFLPAAKAMASESPQHPTRRQPAAVVQEPPREVIKAVNKIKPHLIKRQPPNILRHQMQNEAGQRMQSAAPIRSRIESTYSDSFGGTESQHTKDAANEQELGGKHQDQDFHVDNMLCKRDHLKLDGLSPYRHLQGTTDVSSYQNKSSGIAKAADNSQKEFDQQRKGPCIFRDLLAFDQDDECILPSTSSMVEDTLIINPIHEVDFWYSNFSTPKESPNLKQDDCSTLDKHTEVIDHSRQEFKHMNGANVDAISTPKSSVLSNSSFPSHVKVNHDMQIDMKTCSRPTPEEGNTNGTCTQLSLPLPKSPSESWLQRTLPALSLKNSSKSSFGTGNDMKNHSSKSFHNPKWETLVKTSNTYNGHLRFSEELLTPIPEA